MKNACIKIFVVLLIAMTLASCAQMEAHKRQAARAEVEQYCAQLYTDARIDPIRDKVPINLRVETPIPIQMMANNAIPTEEEQAGILAWAEQRQLCQQRSTDVLGPPPAHLEAVRSANSQAMADLYGGRISYGDFAKQLNQNRMAFIQQNQALLDQANRDALQRQQAFQQLLFQQQQLNLQQQSRQQNAPVNCTTQYIGNQAYTNCH